ncbi:GNAT family N-acetyltransferase [Desulfosporosinus hippei]|uniref:Acetyltransferase (GNAT) domain-containing protein n=1 Tax=Desulfosporosinus hippei DSM 8344 TaxID=1121419 RepID=A0A1G8JMD6_9FIRM|nr:GNAT family N-acetyltransferase [Desulfosporosinus hippei]SDI32459.1 Acetyltransferase (GNAT) domain-containing protein [Desulfosporosinus hippei DSM 8344]
MLETRLAQTGEIDQLKELWRLCFGDPEDYIDLYFANRYKNEDTCILLKNNDISAMLTMLPVKTVFKDHCSTDTAMLYAIGTHPSYQNKGFATQLMDFSNQYLRANKYGLSILVPAKKELFAYYRRRGYQDGFYIRETFLNRTDVDCLPIEKQLNCEIRSATPENYNRIRNRQLKGRLYISYLDQDIVYQKKLSQYSGADIYAINLQGIEGCFAVERVSSDVVLIKEFLLPEELLNPAIKRIVQQITAKEYILRTPAYLGEQLGGSLRLFGLIKSNNEADVRISPKDLGYLGLAFD